MGRKYGISLASWSLHKSMGEGPGRFPLLEMPKIARREFGIEAIELTRALVPSLEPEYLDRLAGNAAAEGVRILLIMVSGQGDLGAADTAEREHAVAAHRKWIDAAARLKCHSVRICWGGVPPDTMAKPEAFNAFLDRSIDPIRQLCDYAAERDLNVLIENHGGPSSHPEAVSQLISRLNHVRFGTLPDFGNFPPEMDRYAAVDAMMPRARAVSAKCYDFDDVTGEETTLDYGRLIEIVADKHGYEGYIGVEYEGDRLSEFDGIKACKRLLEKLRAL